MSIGHLIDQIARIVSNPASNLTGAVLLLAMGVLVLLILSVAALITILPVPDEDDEADEEGAGEDAIEPAPAAPAPAPGANPSAAAAAPRPALPRWLSVGLPLALFAAAVLSGWSVTGRAAGCGSCHATAEAAKGWRTGDHAAVACIACHEDGGIGLPAAAVQRVSDAVAAASGITAPDGAARPVPSYRCLRCHARVARATVKSGAIRVSHREFLERGYDCSRCHAGVGHSPAGGPERAISMNECIGCHDGRTAKSGCATCHVGDPGVAVRVDRAVYTKADIPPPAGCRGCHETASCTACHGIEMPHPAGFAAAKGHASKAAFERKELCWRCHVKQDCRRCHRGDFNAHGPDWRATHPSGVPLDGRNACACHDSPDFCGLCHETGR